MNEDITEYQRQIHGKHHLHYGVKHSMPPTTKKELPKEVEKDSDASQIPHKIEGLDQKEQEQNHQTLITSQNPQQPANFDKPTIK